VCVLERARVLRCGPQGSWIFAISPACCRWWRIADNRQTLRSAITDELQKRERVENKMTENGSDKNKEMERVLLEVITSLQDGQKGFAEIGEHLKDETLKRYFLAESLKRASFRADLEAELHRAGVHDIKESGSAAGAIHRVWADLKSKLGGGDHTLLSTAEAGEDDAKATYKDALEQELPLPIRQLLNEQQAHILTSHDYVKRHRDELASK
jgi:uncharacterized protein (TIGR02284 family)